MYLDGRGLRHRDGRGATIVDDSFLLVLHSGDDGVDFVVPGRPWAARYEMMVDTANHGGRPGRKRLIGGASTLSMQGRSAALLRVRRA